jgi:hypothetical protein
MDNSHLNYSRTIQHENNHSKFIPKWPRLFLKKVVGNSIGYKLTEWTLKIGGLHARGVTNGKLTPKLLTHYPTWKIIIHFFQNGHGYFLIKL